MARPALIRMDFGGIARRPSMGPLNTLRSISPPAREKWGFISASALDGAFFMHAVKGPAGADER